MSAEMKRRGSLSGAQEGTLRAHGTPERWRLLYSANPMVGVIDGFRWAILGESFEIYLPGLAISVIVASIVFATGVLYFQRTERTFADVI